MDFLSVISGIGFAFFAFFVVAWVAGYWFVTREISGGSEPLSKRDVYRAIRQSEETEFKKDGMTVTLRRSFMPWEKEKSDFLHKQAVCSLDACGWKKEEVKE